MSQSGNIPLSSDEVQMIVMASACLNRTYATAVNSLAGLSSVENVMVPFLMLPTLGDSRKALGRIRTDIQENPVLTVEHQAELEILKDSIGEELLHTRDQITTRALRAVDADRVSAESAETIRHGTVGTANLAYRYLQKVFAMVEQKLNPAATPDNLPQSQRQP